MAALFMNLRTENTIIIITRAFISFLSLFVEWIPTEQEQKNVHGRWAAWHPHCAFRHSSSDAQPYLILFRMYGGTSDGVVTGISLEASSLLQPYW